MVRLKQASRGSICYGDDFTVECPTGSGRLLTLMGLLTKEMLLSPNAEQDVLKAAAGKK